MSKQPNFTKQQVHDGFAAWTRFPADERELFERTSTVCKARLPNGAWFKRGPSRYAGVGDRIYGLDWYCRVVRGVTGPGDGVRIEPWVLHPQQGAVKLPEQESNPYEVVEVIDPPGWLP